MSAPAPSSIAASGSLHRRSADGSAQGACPTVDRPFAEVDGALVRVRVPGGRLTVGQVGLLAEAAERVGAAIEITSRANLQLRGLETGDLPVVAAAVTAAGLSSAGEGTEPYGGLPSCALLACDLLASPTAGIDPDELLDTGPLARALARALGHRTGPPVSPKFCVVLDGGGAVHVRGRRHDLALEAVRVGDRPVGYQVRVGGGTGPILQVGPDQALALVLAAVDLAAEAGGRLGDLVDQEGPSATVRRIAGRAGATVEEISSAERAPDVTPPVAPAPVGILAQRQPGLVAVGALPILGRLDPAGLAALGQLVSAAVAGRSDGGAAGGGEVRLTPWRSVLLPGIPAETAEATLDELSARGLVSASRDPALGVVACAGSAGCPAGLADTQADGRRLIELLRAGPLAAEPTGAPVMVHLSGCAKRCAGRQGHELTLLAGPRPGTYDLYRQQAGTALGVAVACGLDPAGAISAVSAAVAARRAEEGAG